MSKAAVRTALFPKGSYYCRGTKMIWGRGKMIFDAGRPLEKGYVVCHPQGDTSPLAVETFVHLARSKVSRTWNKQTKAICYVYFSGCRETIDSTVLTRENSIFGGKRYAMPCAACPWRHALALRLDDFDDLQLQPDLITFNSAISACSTSTAWRMAVVLLQGHSELWESPPRALGCSKMAGNGGQGTFLMILDAKFVSQSSTEP